MMCGSEQTPRRWRWCTVPVIYAQPSHSALFFYFPGYFELDSKQTSQETPSFPAGFGTQTQSKPARKLLSCGFWALTRPLAIVHLRAECQMLNHAFIRPAAAAVTHPPHPGTFPSGGGGR
jgi:hypothetical protein